MNRVALYKKNLNLNYPIAYGGVANRDTAAAVLGKPEWDICISNYFVYRIETRNQIYKIHSGF